MHHPGWNVQVSGCNGVASSRGDWPGSDIVEPSDRGDSRTIAQVLRHQNDSGFAAGHRQQYVVHEAAGHRAPLRSTNELGEHPPGFLPRGVTRGDEPAAPLERCDNGRLQSGRRSSAYSGAQLLNDNGAEMFTSPRTGIRFRYSSEASGNALATGMPSDLRVPSMSSRRKMTASSASSIVAVALAAPRIRCA